jgi:hypothetical protein
MRFPPYLPTPLQAKLLVTTNKKSETSKVPVDAVGLEATYPLPLHVQSDTEGKVISCVP